MSFPIASKTRAQIRESIGYNLGSMLYSTVSSTGTAATLLDSYGLAKGGTNDRKGRQVVIVTPIGSIVAGEKKWVSTFAAGSIGVTPSFSATTTIGDIYELWDEYTIEEVNDAINQAIIAATDDILLDKVDSTTLIKLLDIYEYTIPTGFVALHTVEYEDDVGIKHLISDCEAALTGGTGTTMTADSTFEKVGTACAKGVTASVAATTILCYENISSLDVSDCDKVEFRMYSSIALTAGQLQIKLDDAAAIAGSMEAISIPAMDAGTWYRHSLSLANPHTDTAIISWGIYQVADVADFTFYLDDVNAIKDNSRIYKPLSPDHWGLVQASTNLLQLSELGYTTINDNARLRLNGYQIPSELSTDTTACTIDPDYVINAATASLLMSHARGSSADMDANATRAAYFKQIAEARLRQSRTALENNTRFIS